MLRSSYWLMVIGLFPNILCNRIITEEDLSYYSASLFLRTIAISTNNQPLITLESCEFELSIVSNHNELLCSFVDADDFLNET